jgi:DNA-binding transcriptional LysR family regulator
MALNHAVSCGLGLGVLPCFLAEGNPNLVRISPVLKNVSTEIWILCHQDLRSLPRIRTVTTFLANAFRLAQSKFNPELPASPLGGPAPEAPQMQAPAP